MAFSLLINMKMPTKALNCKYFTHIMHSLNRRNERYAYATDIRLKGQGTLISKLSLPLAWSQIGSRFWCDVMATCVSNSFLDFPVLFSTSKTQDVTYHATFKTFLLFRVTNRMTARLFEAVHTAKQYPTRFLTVWIFSLPRTSC